MGSHLDFDEVIQGELRLLAPDTRGNQQLIRELLHPDFREFGSSGRVWDLESIVQALTSELAPPDVRALDIDATSISPAAILLTYRCEAGNRESLRSSLWVKNEIGRWVLLFHQGTNVGNASLNE